MGKKVLAIDLDPQGNLSFSLGIDDEDAYTIYDVFKGNCDISDAVQKGGICDVIASNILLSGVELELTGVGREYILREQLKLIREELGEDDTVSDGDHFMQEACYSHAVRDTQFTGNCSAKADHFRGTALLQQGTQGGGHSAE